MSNYATRTEVADLFYAFVEVLDASDSEQRRIELVKLLNNFVEGRWQSNVPENPDSSRVGFEGEL